MPSDKGSKSQNEAVQTLSSYEQLRINNIKRNNAKLRELGLISAAEERKSNAITEGLEIQHTQCETTPAKQKKRKNPPTVQEGSRRSLRLQGIGIDLQPALKEVTTIDDSYQERIERVRECREVRLKAANAIAEAGAEKAAKENPTATYEHCLMRVRTMTDKKLLNRVSCSEFYLQQFYCLGKQIEHILFFNVKGKSN
jgi:hypothetical protein